jgi:hypothetical protein
MYMNYPPNDDNQSQFPPPQQPNTSNPPQQPDTSYPYEPLQAPMPTIPPKKKTNGWHVLLVLTAAVGALLFCVMIGGIIATNSGTPAQTSTPTPAASIVDQVTKVLNAYTNPPIVTPYSADSVLVELRATGNQAGEAETLATAVSLASDYQKTIWQANIEGLSSVTVIIVQTDYPGASGTTTNQDIVKCIVTSATGTSLDWGSGTPMQRFQQFDIKWVFGQGTEP